MKILLLMLILALYPAAATVEDTGVQQTASGVAATGIQSVGSVYPSPLPESSSLPDGCLFVTATVAGPSSEGDIYITPGKALEYTVSVKNDGSSDADVDLSIDPGSCGLGWFSWTTKSVAVPAGSTRSEVLQVAPDTEALAGSYRFKVTASSKCKSPGSDTVHFQIQGYDYASETAVSGTGQFQINKDVRSMSSGIKSNKDVSVSGSVDALVKNEYLVDEAKGRNSNFEEKDQVDNYLALQPGDALQGTESFKSSVVFGGIGAKVQESYNLQVMEFEDQSFNLHQTGILGKKAEFKTADNFTGYYSLEAKQIIPGQKNLKEKDVFLGSYEIQRKILFRNKPTPSTASICFDGDNCDNTKLTKAVTPAQYNPVFTSPCQSGTCNSFVDNLNAFVNKAS
jgi:hypothetical protein